jgi:tetratricopeptide (TPR) repeat protein
VKKGDYAKALADCNEAIRLDPKVAMAYDNRGRAYVVLGQLDKAIADFQEALLFGSEVESAQFYSNLQRARQMKEESHKEFPSAIPNALNNLTPFGNSEEKDPDRSGKEDKRTRPR